MMCARLWPGALAPAPAAHLVPADALEGFTFLLLPQPLGEMLTDGHEGVGFVRGICNDLMKPCHFLLSEERKKKTHNWFMQKELRRKKLIMQRVSIQTELPSV